jgi:hypothetical protein
MSVYNTMYTHMFSYSDVNPNNRCVFKVISRWFQSGFLLKCCVRPPHPFPKYMFESTCVQLNSKCIGWGGGGLWTSNSREMENINTVEVLPNRDFVTFLT